jgi:hypothetical protein
MLQVQVSLRPQPATWPQLPAGYLQRSELAR